MWGIFCPLFIISIKDSFYFKEGPGCGEHWVEPSLHIPTSHLLSFLRCEQQQQRFCNKSMTKSNLTEWPAQTFLTGQVLVGSHTPGLEKLYLCLQLALYMVLVNLHEHNFEMPEAIHFSRPLRGVTTLKGAHYLINYPIIQSPHCFLSPSRNLA